MLRKSILKKKVKKICAPTTAKVSKKIKNKIMCVYKLLKLCLLISSGIRRKSAKNKIKKKKEFKLHRKLL